MLKDALKYLVNELAPANIQEVTLPDGTVQVYSDKSMQRLAPHIPMAESIGMITLTSLVDYIKNNIDVMAGKMIIGVKSPTEVVLFSQLNQERDREVLVKVNAMVPEFCFDHFIDSEEFIINMQAKFLDDPDLDKELVLKFAGTVENGSIATYGDDGVSQKATIKTGISSKEAALVPNPVRLRPYRTFLEVTQPASDFIFRMKESSRGGIACALFEADGGAWRIAATKAIKEYLQFELADYADQFIVIA